MLRTRNDRSPFMQYALVRYVLSGLIATCVHLGLLYALTEFAGFWYLASTSIAVIFAFTTSFILQKFWTFQSASLRRIPKQVASYAVIVGVTLSVNAVAMYVLVDVVGLWYMFAQIIMIGIIATGSFVMYGRFVFNVSHASMHDGHTPLRVLVATPLYPPQIGGPATYTRVLEDEFPKKGVPVTVVSFGSVRSLPVGVRHTVYFFDLLVQGTTAHVIYALDPVSVGAPAALTSLILGKKFVIKIVGDYAWEQHQLQIANCKLQISLEKFQMKRFDWKTEIRRRVEHFVARRAHKIIVPSEYLKKIVLQWGVSEEKITVIYNAFEPPEIEETKEELRERLGLSGKIIISAGRFVPWKGFGMLIELMPEIIKEIPDAKLYIVGDGPEYEKCKFQIANLKLHDKVFLTGTMEHRALLRYLKAADLFVLNTGYEGFSHLLLEVMSVGTPIITTDVGGNQELIKDGITGILVSSNDNDALLEHALAFCRAPRHPLAENAKERAKEFSKEKMIAKTVKLLKTL